MFNYLEENIREENRFYLYNYIFNNCSTKIRDVLGHTLGNKLKFNDSPENLSYRDLMGLYLDNYEWADLGIDICLGQKIDTKSSSYEAMFLPEYLFSSLESATIEGGKKLVLRQELII